MAFFRKSAAGALETKAPLRGLEIPSADANVIQIPATVGPRPNEAGALYPDASFEQFARHGMGRNELVAACITEKASSLPQSTLRVYPDPQGQGEPLEQHPLRKLIAEPNPLMGEFEFFELQMIYQDLAGACWTLIERGRDGITPARLWPLRPDRIRVLPPANPVGNPTGHTWLYVPDPAQPQVIVPIAQENMIRVRYPNPLDAYFGWPPLRPAARAIALDNATTEYVDTLLRNLAVPSVVITSQQVVDDEIAERLGRKWRQRFGGSRRGEPAFLQAGMAINVVGLSLQQLEFPDLRSTAESRICMSLGVPPILIGARVGLDRSTFANYGEARTSFWEETIMPMQGRFEANFRQRLLASFLGVGRARVYLRWDNSGVLALRESEAARWDRATAALRAGGITINDFRRTVGLPPVDGADVFLTPAGVAPTPLGQTPPRPAPPAPAEPTTPEPESPAEREAAAYAAAVVDRARRDPNNYAAAVLARARTNGGQGADHD